MKALILGGVRSGKSRHAEQLALHSGGSVVVIVTATPGDEEMSARIAAHRARRPREWRVVEESIHLADTLGKVCQPDTAVIIDCLTLWLTNLLLHEDPELLQRESAALLSVLPEAAGTVVLVSNEVGSGIIPANELCRRFMDATGVLHQRLAAICDGVTLMVAGLPMPVKSPRTAERAQTGRNP